MRVVFDANVLLAAFGTRGLCEALYETCLTSHEIVVSEHILAELGAHPFDKFKMPHELADEVVALVREYAAIVEPAEVSADACRDAADRKVLGRLVAGQADCLVTGDRDLLVLKEFAGKPIVSPRSLHDRLS